MPRPYIRAAGAIKNKLRRKDVQNGNANLKQNKLTTIILITLNPVQILLTIATNCLGSEYGLSSGGLVEQ